LALIGVIYQHNDSSVGVIDNYGLPYLRALTI
jgi:hypothetical protein